MQTDNACVLDIICVGPGGGSPDGLLFPLLVSTEKPCFPKQMWAIFPAEHQPTSNTRARLAHCLLKTLCGNSNSHDIFYHLKEFTVTVPQMINQTAFNSENYYLINAFSGEANSNKS